MKELKVFSLTSKDGKMGAATFTLVYHLGQPVAVLERIGNMANTTPLDPKKLKQSDGSNPKIDYFYEGLIVLDNPPTN